jgi:choline kinase
MDCLIIAAGLGSRFSPQHNSKPLIPVLGVPLIERVIRSASEAGADEFYVVVGHRSSTLTDFLHELAPRLDRAITVIENSNWDKLENGGSVLKARDFLTGPFLLLMADHLLEPSIVRTLISQRPSNGDIAWRWTAT